MAIIGASVTVLKAYPISKATYLKSKSLYKKEPLTRFFK